MRVSKAEGIVRRQEIRRKFRTGKYRLKDLAEEYGISPPAVHYIIHGKQKVSKTHQGGISTVRGKSRISKTSKGNVGPLQGDKRVEKIRELREKFRTGKYSLEKLAGEYRVTVSWLSRTLIRRRNYEPKSAYLISIPEVRKILKGLSAQEDIPVSQEREKSPQISHGRKKELPERDLLLLRLVYDLNEFSTTQVGELWGIKAPTIYSRIHHPKFEGDLGKVLEYLKKIINGDVSIPGEDSPVEIQVSQKEEREVPVDKEASARNREIREKLLRGTHGGEDLMVEYGISLQEMKTILTQRQGYEPSGAYALPAEVLRILLKRRFLENPPWSYCLNPIQVRKARRLLVKGASLESLEKRFKVSSRTLDRALRGEGYLYKHVPFFPNASEERVLDALKGTLWMSLSEIEKGTRGEIPVPDSEIPVPDMSPEPKEALEPLEEARVVPPEPEEEPPPKRGWFSRIFLFWRR
ncbi:MAG: hypothetical protein Q8P59_08865 [Dehalococcoidia bacterium]|nr:hypothetical protein [Dehalococcoidia bacterium]